MTWTADPFAARREEREALLALARAHAERVAVRLPLVTAIVAGSVARGDFNVWSDVDLLVVSDALSSDPRERFAQLSDGRPGRVEVHGYTPDELERALARGDALAREATARGVVVVGALPETR